MTAGELALLAQFQALKWVKAGFKIHSQSFRSQFVTGSTAVGFANSNMQMHGYWFEDTRNELGPWNMWTTGSPSTTRCTLGTDIINLINPPLGGPTSNKVAKREFVPLPFTPWFNMGTIANGAVGAAEYPGETLVNYQSEPLLMQGSYIIGKKVKEWNREYNLAAMWHNKFIPIKPHLLPINWTGNAVIQDGTTNIPSAASAGTWADTWIHNNVSSAIGQSIADTCIVPQYPGCYDQPSRSIEGSDGIWPDDNASRIAGVGAIPRGDLGMFTTPMLAVEQLTNQDGSVVPAAWDFYISTEIVVEVMYNSGGIYPQSYVSVVIPPNAPVGAPQTQFSLILPHPYQATVNDQNMFFADQNVIDDHMGVNSNFNRAFGQQGYLGRGRIAYNTNKWA